MNLLKHRWTWNLRKCKNSLKLLFVQSVYIKMKSECEECICIFSSFLWKCNCVLTWTPHGEVAFIRKVVYVVARPSTHTSLQGASPQALSGLPAPLSTHLLYKQAQAHRHSHIHYVITVKADCAEKMGWSQIVLKSFQLAQCKFTLFWLFWEQQESDWSQSLRHWMVIAEQLVMTFICAILYSIINSCCFATTILLSHLQPLQ